MDYRDNPQRRARHHTKWTSFARPLDQFCSAVDSFGRFVAGTLIGVVPGIVVVAIFEDRLEATIRDPRFEIF